MSKLMAEASAIIPIEMLLEPSYFSSRELTTKPVIVQDVAPELSFSDSKLLQSTVIRLFINEYGDVDQVMFEDSDFPVNTIQLITTAFEKMKFQPGMLENMPVKSQMKIEVTFKSILQLPETMQKITPSVP